MDNRLKLLYQLQKIDSQLDELEELRGDLPETVAVLESKVAESETKSTELDTEIQTILAQRNRLDDQIEELKIKGEKYKSNCIPSKQIRNTMH